MPEWNPETVRQQVEKIAASEIFLQSDRLCRFLRFTVQAKLNGEATQIKEYLLGREVFDRNGDYDPRTDPIVRVEARRLRKKLDEYYSGPGAGDPLRIVYPKGSYTPEFIATNRKRNPWMLLPALAVIAVLSLLFFYRPTDPNTIVVIPARWVWKSESFPATAHDVDLAERVAAELANRHRAAVIGWPMLQRFQEGNRTAPQIAGAVRAGRSLIVSVREEPEGLRVTAFLLDARTDRKIRIEDKPAVQLASVEQRTQVAQDIAAAMLAQK